LKKVFKHQSTGRRIYSLFLFWNFSSFALRFCKSYNVCQFYLCWHSGIFLFCHEIICELLGFYSKKLSDESIVPLFIGRNYFLSYLAQYFKIQQWLAN
jgi:hypothetical protein